MIPPTLKVYAFPVGAGTKIAREIHHVEYIRKVKL